MGRPPGNKWPSSSSGKEEEGPTDLCPNLSSQDLWWRNAREIRGQLVLLYHFPNFELRLESCAILKCLLAKWIKRVSPSLHAISRLPLEPQSEIPLSLLGRVSSSHPSLSPSGPLPPRPSLCPSLRPSLRELPSFCKRAKYPIIETRRRGGS